MWLHIPPEYSQSAPGAEHLTSELESLSQMLALSVTWNEKLSLSRTWVRRLKRHSWLMRLFGTTSGPLTASRGVERWIGSLAESPANLTPSRGSAGAVTTPATSGPTAVASSESAGLDLSFSKTLMASNPTTGHELDPTFVRWATGIRKDCGRRLKWAQARGVNVGSLWHTPTRDYSSSDTGEWTGRYYIRENGVKVTSQLVHQAANWPAPTGYATKGGLWPTATAQDQKGPSRHGQYHPHPSLPMAAKMWPEPGRDSGLPEEGHPVDGYLGRVAGSPNLAQSVVEHSHQAPTIQESGHTCSPVCRRLNPLFVEWLMGWPLGWTLFSLGVLSFESSATAWSHWQQQGLSELLDSER